MSSSTKSGELLIERTIDPIEAFTLNRVGYEGAYPGMAMDRKAWNHTAAAVHDALPDGGPIVELAVELVMNRTEPLMKACAEQVGMFALFVDHSSDVKGRLQSDCHLRVLNIFDSTRTDADFISFLTARARGAMKDYAREYMRYHGVSRREYDRERTDSNGRPTGKTGSAIIAEIGVLSLEGLTAMDPNQSTGMHPGAYTDFTEQIGDRDVIYGAVMSRTITDRDRTIFLLASNGDFDQLMSAKEMTLLERLQQEKKTGGKLTLKQIGNYFGIGESQTAQIRKRIRQQILQDIAASF